MLYVCINVFILKYMYASVNDKSYTYSWCKWVPILNVNKIKSSCRFSRYVCRFVLYSPIRSMNFRLAFVEIALVDEQIHRYQRWCHSQSMRLFPFPVVSNKSASKRKKTNQLELCWPDPFPRCNHDEIKLNSLFRFSQIKNSKLFLIFLTQTPKLSFAICENQNRPSKNCEMFEELLTRFHGTCFC